MWRRYAANSSVNYDGEARTSDSVRLLQAVVLAPPLFMAGAASGAGRSKFRISDLPADSAFYSFALSLSFTRAIFVIFSRFLPAPRSPLDHPEMRSTAARLLFV